MPAIIPLEDPPTPEWFATFHSLLGGMTTGLIQWAGHGAGPVTNATVDAMLMRMVQAAVRCTNTIYGTSVPTGEDAPAGTWAGV